MWLCSQWLKNLVHVCVCVCVCVCRINCWMSWLQRRPASPFPLKYWSTASIQYNQCNVTVSNIGPYVNIGLVLTVSQDNIIMLLTFNLVLGHITLTSVCVRALPVSHYWSQTNNKVWSLSCWILLLSTVSYRKYLFKVCKMLIRWQNFITTNFHQLKPAI